MGHGPLFLVVKFHWRAQQVTLCYTRSFKLSQLFESHQKMKSMHTSEKLLKLIHPGLSPQAWIWKMVFSLEFSFHFVCFPFKSTATIKESDFFSSAYENKPFNMLNLCIWPWPWLIIRPLLLSYVKFDSVWLSIENVHS